MQHKDHPDTQKWSSTMHPPNRKLIRNDTSNEQLESIYGLKLGIGSISLKEFYVQVV
jgi:hypothetical protein